MYTATAGFKSSNSFQIFQSCALSAPMGNRIRMPAGRTQGSSPGPRGTRSRDISGGIAVGGNSSIFVKCARCVGMLRRGALAT